MIFISSCEERNKSNNNILKEIKIEGGSLSVLENNQIYNNDYVVLCRNVKINDIKIGSIAVFRKK